MKRVYYFTGLGIAILLVTGSLSFVGSNNAVRTIATVDCDTKSSAIAENAVPTPFVDAKNEPAAVLIRKNVYSLTAAEIASLKTGIAAMKALPISDPTSWKYQAAIHGTFTTPVKPSWNTCQHGTQFFLSWHRMYLYFFERILRKKSGNPNLTLPYWNYQTNPVLHPDYRNSAASNPLYDNTRAASINSGGSLPSSPMVAINNALNKTSYFTFQGDLEVPHGSIHVAVGGDMSLFETAGLDPVFWLHHANIDRLWEAWLRKCGARQNPTSNAWRTQSYTFFNENGTAVVMTGAQIVSTASQLNYRYDFIPAVVLCNVVVAPNFRFLKATLLASPAVVKLNQKVSKMLWKDAKPDSLDAFVKKERTDKLNFTDSLRADRLLLQLDGLTVRKVPEGVIEIYLNLPQNETPKPDSKFFVGVLDLFTPLAMMHHGGGDKTVSIDVSRAAQALNLKISDLKNGQLTFLVRGNTLQGQEITTTADIDIRSMKFAIERVSN